MKPLAVDPAAIVEQRAKGWPDFHPEDYCQRCGHRNMGSWFVAGTLWEAAKMAREGDWPGSDIVCPQCFTEAFEAATGLGVTWELTLHEETLRCAIRRLASSRTGTTGGGGDR